MPKLYDYLFHFLLNINEIYFYSQINLFYNFRYKKEIFHIY